MHGFFFPFYRNLPFQPSKSQSACLRWIIIKQLQWVFRGALREWCNRDTTKRPLCYPRWAEVTSLKRPDLELVTLWQYKKKKSTFARLSSGWLRTWCMCVSVCVCVHQWHTKAFPRCCISCYSDKKGWTSEHREWPSPRVSRWNCNWESGISDSLFFVFFFSVIWATDFLSLFSLCRSNKLMSTIFDLNHWPYSHGGHFLLMSCSWWGTWMMGWCCAAVMQVAGRINVGKLTNCFISSLTGSVETERLLDWKSGGELGHILR